MRYNVIRSLDISNGLGVGIALFVQGCPFRCTGCFNPETWDFKGGLDFNEQARASLFKAIEPSYIERFSLLGGEPLVHKNRFEIACLIQSIKVIRPDIKIWVYTGYTLEALLEDPGPYLVYILENIDVLVDGQFIQEQKDITLPFCGSRNQRVIDIQKTLKEREIVLLDV